MFATAVENIRTLYNYLFTVPGLKYKFAELTLSLIAYCKTLTLYSFGYWEIFVSQTAVLGTFTILQSLTIMRFHRVPPRAFEQVVVGVYGVVNIICAFLLAHKIHAEKVHNDTEAQYAHLTCITPDFTDKLYLDYFWLFLFNILLGILMVFDSLSL